MYTPRNPNDPRQVEACRLREGGMRRDHVARLFGVSPPTISGWTDQPCRVRHRNEAKSGRKTNVARFIRENAKNAYNLDRFQEGNPDPSEKQDVLKLMRICRWVTHFTGVPHEVDHIIPLNNGGQSTLDNLQILTQTQNRKKGHAA